jgi:hypothetical protein
MTRQGFIIQLTRQLLERITWLATPFISIGGWNGNICLSNPFEEAYHSPSDGLEKGQ